MAISFIPFIPVDNFFSFFATWRFFVQNKAAGFPPSPGWSSGEIHDEMKHCRALFGLPLFKSRLPIMFTVHAYGFTHGEGRQHGLAILSLMELF
jgi:hypothetical protein